MTAARGRYAGTLALCALVVAWWGVRSLAPGARVTIVSLDLRNYFLPLYEAFYTRVASGRLPLWNPYQLCGLPWIGTVQGGFFYPPHALYLLFPPRVALAVSGLGHLLLAALSTATLARAVGLEWPAAALSATVFTLRGALPAYIFWPTILEPAAWLPLGALAVLRLARGGGRRDIVLLAVASGMTILAGAPQLTVFLGYAWATLLPASLAGAGAPLRRWPAASARFAVGLGLGGLLGAAAFLPGVEMARVAIRPAGQIAVAKMYVFGYAGFGIARQAISGGSASSALLGVSLACAGALVRRHRALAIWALAVGGLAVGFAIGPASPLFPVYLALPGLGVFRAPQRIMILADFALALLAGMGLDALVRRLRETAGTPARLPLAAPPLGCALLLAAYLGRHHAYVPALLAVGTAAVLVAAASGRAGARLVAGLLLALGALEVLVLAPGAEPLPYDAASAAAYREHADTYETLARLQGPDRVWILNPWQGPKLAQKLASLYRVRAIDDYESLNLRRQAEFLTYAMEGATEPRAPNRFFQGRLVLPLVASGPVPLATRRRLLDLAALRLIAIEERMLDAFASAAVRAIADAGLVREPSPGHGMALFRNPHALPRAFVVYRTRPAPPAEELLRRLSDPGFDPLVESFVEGDPGFVAAADAPARGEAATFVRDEEEVVEVEATAAAPGLLVLADSFYPGWRATVDGATVPIFATNHLFRGVPLAAGRHRVRFEYAARSERLGLLASVLAAAILGVMIVRARRADPA